MGLIKTAVTGLLIGAALGSFCQYVVIPVARTLWAM